MYNRNDGGQTMNKLLKDYKRDYIFLSIGYIVMGSLLLFIPETSGKVMCYILAGISSFFGITHLISYLHQEYPYETYRFDLVYGIVGLAGGAFVFMRPELLIQFLPIILGVIVFIDSIVKIQYAVDLNRMKYEKWYIILILALAMTGLSLLILKYPFSSLMTVVMFTGIGLIVNAIVNLYAIFTLSKIVDELHNTHPNNLKKDEMVKEESKETTMNSSFDIRIENIEKKED